MLSRRSFLAAAGNTLAALSLRAGVTNQVPANLDHILFGCRDLDEGVAFVEQRTGVCAEYGGVHPGRGTRNALLSLGERHYLEIIAPDPAQPDAKNPLAIYLRTLSESRLVGWAAHCTDLAGVVSKLRDAGIGHDGPIPGSRNLPNGQKLQWKMLTLKENPDYLLPFFIEWAADSPHPATSAPRGCSLVQFELLTPDPASVTKTVALLSLDVSVAKGEKPRLHAIVSGPKGELEMSS
jgi:hypothetical protein